MADIFEKCFAWNDADEARATGYYPFFQPISETFGTEVMLRGKRLIMIGSNNYMGLTTDPRVKEAAIKAIEKFGSSCSGSRFLNGTLELHEELEAKLATFFRKESAIVFSTGFQTNQGTIPPLLNKDDVVFIDRGDHASILDGVDLSAAERKRFRHNEPADLERLLASADKDAGKLIVVDGVFSMEGDIAPLPKIVELKKKYGARLMVDDAHGAGVLGATGRGTSEHFGVEAEADLIMTTFSKSFASLGGVITGPRKVLDWVKHRSRALIFSASMTPASVAAALKALEIIQAEPQRRERLLEIARKMRTAYQKMGFDTGTSELTPIIPLIIGEDMRTFLFWKELLDAGVFTNPVRMPAVPPGQQLIRTSYMATHTDAQLDKVLGIVEEVGKKHRIIGPDALPRPEVHPRKAAS